MKTKLRLAASFALAVSAALGGAVDGASRKETGPPAHPSGAGQFPRQARGFWQPEQRQPPRQQQQQQGEEQRGKQEPQQQQIPTFRAAANYVRVDVYPTADGRPVTDLTAGDFEVLEDGVRQKVEGFEHVVVRAAGPQELRVEPNTVAEADRMAQDPRSRVFVLFLDTYHVTLAGSGIARQPIVRMLERVLGPDDLVAVMTPEMSARDLTFARRTTTIDGMLQRWWEWGRRQRLTEFDPQEEEYMRCYPAGAGERAFQSWVAREMIARRREKMTLDAFEDLVVHLEGVREERKAVITMSEGWQLFGRNRALADVISPEMPGMYVGRGGKIMVGDDPRIGPTGSRSNCDRDRLMLAELDNGIRFRSLLNQANRANVSFYPVDPRGLPAFDAPIGPDPPPPPHLDQANLTHRIDTLRTLAENTDGIAIVNSNDLDRGLKRITDDLTSYYLLGYYSTNDKADGRYRRITVRVKRPGVNVRARSGYQAPTREELEARDAVRAAAAEPAVPSATAEALAGLAARRRDAWARVRSGYGWRTSAAGAPEAWLWVVGELDAVRARDPEWQEGASAKASVSVAAEGDAVASGEASLSRAARVFTLDLPAAGGDLAPGEYTVRIVWDGPFKATESLRVTVPAGDAGEVRVGEPMYFRRGPFTGAAIWQPTADQHFRRQERLRIDVPVSSQPGKVTARLLDKTGGEMSIPVTAGQREQGGVRCATAELALAPMAQGEYIIEICIEADGSQQKVLAAFRIVP